jgi:hypothetical protein
MKVVYTGLESGGKSLAIAQVVLKLLKTNIYWKKKYGFHRYIYSNLRFSDSFYNKYKDFIIYWDDVREVIGLSGCDIIWDEISSDFSALKREPLSRKVNRWLRQGAKQGVHIYATAQEYHDIHLDMRRRFKFCYHIEKWIGSDRPGKNLPPVKFIWGICLVRSIKIHPYNEIRPEKLNLFPGLIFISKELCSIFNTSQVIEESKEIPLDHRERYCPVPGCKYHEKPLITH